MTFMMEPHTGVIRLSNKRRQGMKLSYQLNVSVSDGVFTNSAQVKPLFGSYNLVLSTDLLFFKPSSVNIIRWRLFISNPLILELLQTSATAVQ